MRLPVAVPLAAALVIAPCFADTPASADAPASAPAIEAVLAHPVYATDYTCSEHAAGELQGMGDELGQDCVIQAFVKYKGRLFMRSFRNEGLRNEDWYGWNQPVLSPCDCTVAAIHINPVTNRPGIVGKPPSTSIRLQRADGVMFLVAHVQSLKVKEGDTVRAGQPIGQVGNNGFARIPHVHIGAWRGTTPLQIRWDQTHIPIT